MDVALAQHAGAFGGDAEQVAGARLVDLRERAEDGGNQDGAAIVRLGGLLEHGRIGLDRLPFAFLVLFPR